MRAKLKISSARSMDNGIQFYSKRHKGYVAISTVDELGNINTEWITIRKYKKEKNRDNKIADIKRTLMYILYILPFVTIFTLLLEWAMSKDPMLAMRFFLIGYAFILLGSFILTTYIESKKEKNPYKFHSAEHMVLNAYRKLKRVPSIEEVHEYSRFSNSCGTNGTTQIFISFTLMFLCTFIHNPLYRVIGMFAVNVIVLVLLQCGFLNFLQNFTTMPPTQKELAVAIAGMNLWLENEKKKKEKSIFLKFLHRLFPRVFN